MERLVDEVNINVNGIVINAKIVKEKYLAWFGEWREEDIIIINIAGLSIPLYYLTWYNSLSGGLFPTAPTRGQRKKKHVILRKKLGVNKKEYCHIMGYVGGVISKYFGERWL